MRREFDDELAQPVDVVSREAGHIFVADAVSSPLGPLLDLSATPTKGQ